FWADTYDGIVVHLEHRDASFVAVSTAPLEKLQAYRKRMGWSFKWVSSRNNDFNRDFHVSFTPRRAEDGGLQLPSWRLWLVGGAGHQRLCQGCSRQHLSHLSCYARGLDALNGAYQLIDLLPKGRDEDDLPHPMAWVRRHDRYDTE
ncbi:MAG: DUF899 family protein, partial [Hyphomicrobiaceae bacterium]|nr:DUF899 family protein [Hyphomicrobiaceae bacterium]